MTRVEHIGDATLYLGDCRAVLPTLGAVDAVVTDPPYGVGFRGSATRWSAPSGLTYASFSDTPDKVADVYVHIIEQCRKIAKAVVLTPGIPNARLYPQPDGEGVIWYPSGANRGPWGFVTHQPIYYYGKCPFLSSGRGSYPTGFQSTEAAEENGHPCPKPIKQTMWLVHRVSRQYDTVLDPFMGSGTTGVACARLGRRFVGIEIEPKYYEIALRRIEQAYRQRDLFIHTPVPEPPEDVRLADLFVEPGAIRMTSAAFTGQLKRGDTPDTIVGYLRESPWGWTIRLFGTRDPGGGYTITGTLDTPPEGLRIPAIDDAPVGDAPP